MPKTFILGIETSCDDTAASVILDSKVLSNVSTGQEIHNEYGGVVPELASRIHINSIIPVVRKAINLANIRQNDLNAIGFTRGPGLLGSLLVGVSFAKSLAMALDIPLIEVNHLQAHILCHFIADANDTPPKFPFLCLTVSGGHTLIVLVKDYFDMETLGSTTDDAAGEAFDKVGKIFGLDYPAGPAIDRLSIDGDGNTFRFNKPKIGGYDYSFSGIKTSVLYFIQKKLGKNPNFVKENLNDLCASIQKSIVEILLEKLIKASEDTGIKEIAISGGVSANSELRSELRKLAQKKRLNIYIPRFEYTTDNAAMVAMVAYIKYQRRDFSNLRVRAEARYDI